MPSLSLCTCTDTHNTVIAGMTDVSVPVPPTATYKLHWVEDASSETAVTSENVTAGVTAAPLLAEANSAGGSSSSSVSSGAGGSATSYGYCTLIDSGSEGSSSSSNDSSSSSTSSSKILYADEQTMAAAQAATVSDAP
jgi:hypothetical protein